MGWGGARDLQLMLTYTVVTSLFQVLKMLIVCLFITEVNISIKIKLGGDKFLHYMLSQTCFLRGPCMLSCFLLLMVK
jgi:hypothetical protein